MLLLTKKERKRRHSAEIDWAEGFHAQSKPSVSKYPHDAPLWASIGMEGYVEDHSVLGLGLGLGSGSGSG
jgi:hypothetical protein